MQIDYTVVRNKVIASVGSFNIGFYKKYTENESLLFVHSIFFQESYIAKNELDAQNFIETKLKTFTNELPSQ